jgi:protocatechuate 3,4-dioxygenase beta subunit
MGRWLPVLVSVSAVVVLSAQPPAQVPAAPPRDARPPVVEATRVNDARVFGRVVDAGTSRPLRGAFVVAVPQRLSDGTLVTDARDAETRPTATRTDDDGRFALRDLMPGEYVLVARRSGYVQQQLGQASHSTPGRHLVVHRGAVAGPLAFALVRSGVISGRVVDATGIPADRVTVYAAHVRRVPGGLRPQSVAHATTDDLGEFRVFGLPPGRYVVSAVPYAVSAPRGAFTTDAERDLVPTFAPSVTNVHEAQVMDVGPGDEVEAQIHLVEAVVSTIAGRAIDSRGAPVTAAFVGLRPRGGSRISSGGSTPVSQDGSFTLRGIAPGAYTLSVSPQISGSTADERAAHLARSEVGMLDVDVSGDITGLVVTTQPGTTVRGRLVVDGDASRLRDREVRVQATFTGPWSEQARAVVRPDLTFELPGVRGPAVLRLGNAPDGWWTRTVRIGGVDATDGHDFGVARTVADVEIVVSTVPSGARGRVVAETGHAAVDAVVIGFDEDRRKWGQPVVANTFMVRPVEDGTWSIDRLRPGAYRLIAVPVSAARGDDLGDPEYLEALDRRARTVVIGEGRTPDVVLEVQP